MSNKPCRKLSAADIAQVVFIVLGIMALRLILAVLCLHVW